MTYKHRDVVIAWMDGETIQYKGGNGHWYDIMPFNSGTWFLKEAYECRIKPKPVMIRHASFPSGAIYVFLKNYSKEEDEAVAMTDDREDITWLDEWHEAAFSAPEQI